MNKQYKVIGLSIDPGSPPVTPEVIVQLQAINGGDTITFRFSASDPLIAQLTIGRTINAVFTFA